MPGYIEIRGSSPAVVVCATSSVPSSHLLEEGHLLQRGQGQPVDWFSRPDFNVG
jgi:hypothetical protein